MSEVLLMYSREVPEDRPSYVALTVAGTDDLEPIVFKEYNLPDALRRAQERYSSSDLVVLAADGEGSSKNKPIRRYTVSTSPTNPFTVGFDSVDQPRVSIGGSSIEWTWQRHRQHSTEEVALLISAGTPIYAFS